MTTAAPQGGYTLANTWERAHYRLGRLEQVFDPGTKERLEALGVGPGWRCLEVGPGRGSIARWLCDRVGPDGQVVAVDLDTRFVREGAPPNLEVHERDVVADGLPGGGYDLVHTRFLLVHLAQRDRVLAAMAGALRPGGKVLLEECDFHNLTDPGTSHPQTSRLSAMWRDCCRVVESTGGDWRWGKQLPAALAAAGLVDVEARSEIDHFRGGSAYAEIFSLTFEQLTPLLLEAGVAAADIDAAAAEMSDPDRWFEGLTLTAATGTAP